MIRQPPIASSFSGVPDGVLRLRSGFRPLEAPTRDAIVLQIPFGTPVVAIADGEVIARLWSAPGTGHTLRIDHGADADGTRWISDYLNLATAVVRQWSEVRAGQLLGHSGRTPIPDSAGRTEQAAMGFLLRRNGRTTDPLPAINWSPFELHTADLGGWRCYFRPERTGHPRSVSEWERAMISAGLHLGAGGPASDGVDGQWSELDQFALESFQTNNGLRTGRRDRATAELLIAVATSQRQAA